MTAIPQSVRDFLATGPYAHIVTLDSDGTPHVSLAWAGVAADDPDEVVWASFSDQRKLDNLRRDPRVVLSFQANEWTGQGMYPYLVVQGRARVSPGGSLDVMDHLAGAYIAPGAKFPMRDVPPGFTIRVDVDRIYGVGPWKEALGRES